MTRTDTPVLFFLHALGGSARAWDGVIRALSPRHACVALDLPGFGDAAGLPPHSLAQTVARCAEALRARAPRRFVLVGHSMGGKVAALLAARAEAGEAGLEGLAGIVLVAGSPPGPEPMDEARRTEMLGWLEATASMAEPDARRFVDANTARPLPEPEHALALADLRRCAPHAWRGWLERGSREDHRDRVGALGTPALLIAGAEDGDLGEDGQRAHNLPHYRNGRLAILAGAAHLLPLEATAALAAAIENFLVALALPPDLARLVESDRVTTRTRDALLARVPEPTNDPRVLSRPQSALLAALLERLLPQRGTALDLAARIDRMLAGGPGDGWRFAALPPDAEAYVRALDTLAECAPGFAGLLPEARDQQVERMMAGELGLADRADRLSPAQMALWIEDARADAVRTWLGHPAALARIGYDGFANGGDAGLVGFVDLAADPAAAP